MNLQALSNEPDERLVARIDRFNRATLEVVLTLATVTLLCWLLPPLRERVPAAWLTLKANTSLGLMMVSASLWLSRQGMGRHALRVAQALSVAVLAIGFATAFQYVTGVDLGIDVLLADDPYAHPPGRMSIQSVVGFVLLGPVLMLMRSTKSRTSVVADSLTLALAAFVLVTAASYLFDAAGLFRVGEGRLSSPQALACFAVLAVVTAFRRAQYGVFSVLVGVGIGSRIGRIILPLALLLPFVLATLRALATGRGWLSQAHTTALSAAVQAFFMLCVVLWMAWRINFLERELRAMSLVDELTGIHNRRGFYLLADQVARAAKRSRQPLTVFFIDVDGLKKVNDSFGHEAGSRYIADVAQLLKATFREGDIVARVGGDEFAVVAVNPDETSALLRRLDEGVAALNRRGDRPYRVGMSVGHAELEPESPEPFDAVLERADAAMYVQKQARRRARDEPAGGPGPA
jgi:diguanylate cyclase (GGDEF)-like protein